MHDQSMIPWGHHAEETPFLVKKDRGGSNPIPAYSSRNYLPPHKQRRREGGEEYTKSKTPMAKSNRFTAKLPLLDLEERVINAS